MSIRTDFAEQYLPFVTRLKKPKPCEGRRVRQCKCLGYWKFTPLGLAVERKTYCWAHLFTRGLHSTPAEYARTQRFVKKYWQQHAEAYEGRQSDELAP